jgi:hypothetical protein
MVYGRMPFPGNSKTDLLFNIFRKHPLFGEEDGVAASLKRLIGKCLDISVEKRINWRELFEWGK